MIMATYRVSGPNGQTYDVTGPDGATPEQVFTVLQQHVTGAIDFDRPDDQVRADVAKLDGPFREHALTGWSDARVKKDHARGIRPLTPEPTRGIPFIGGLLDEATSGIEAGLHAVSGGRIGKPYEEALAYERARMRAEDKTFPVLAPVTRVATGLATGGPLFSRMAPAATAGGRIAQGAAVGAGTGAVEGFAAGEGGFTPRVESALKGGALGGVLGGAIPVVTDGVRAAQRAYANQGRAGAHGSMAESLPGTVDEFADQVAAGASRNNVTTNRRALDILGEEMERAGGDRLAAQQATIARIAQEQGITPQAAQGQIRRLTQVHEGSDLMLGEYPAVSGSDAAQRLRRPGNVDLDELGRTQESRTQGLMDYLANNGGAQSAQNVRNTISVRQEQLSPSMRGTLETIGPRVPTGARTTRPGTIVDAADMIDAARRAGQAEYHAAYNGAINNAVAVNDVPAMITTHLNRAAGRSGEASAAIRRAVDEFMIDLPTGQRVTMQSLQHLQDARGAVRGMIEEARRQGRDHIVNALQPLYRETTDLMTRMSPQWARANARWADMNFQRMGTELGDAFALRAGPQFREQMAEFHRLAPDAQNIVRVHFLQKLYDKLDNLNDTNSISKLFANDHSRSMIARLLGDDAAVTFTRAVRDQKVAEQTQRMTANSATHRRGVAQRQMDAETGIMTAVENASARGVRNWLIERMTQLATERRNRPLAEIVTTPMRDTAGVAQAIHNMRGQQQRLQQYAQPSRGTLPAAAAIGQITGGLTADRRPR
ncbi:MAG: hypothetical protein IT537_04665 [Hyphomicrobiales bacterium]|nr:hypothetical protein [Hyphomicrobiales bacterium]